MKLLKIKPSAVAAAVAELPTDQAFQVIAAKAKANELADTPFGRAFLRYDSMDMTRDFGASYAVWAIGTAGFRHYLINSLYGNLTSVLSGAFNMDASDDNMERLFYEDASALLRASRLRKKGSRIIVSIPVGRVDLGNVFYPSTSWSTTGALPQTPEVIGRLVQNIQNSKFKALLTTDKRLDITVSAEDVLAITPRADYEERTVGRNEPGFINTFAQTFTKFRFLRASLADLATAEQKRTVLGSTFGSNMPFDEISVAHPAFQIPQVAVSALNLMLSPAIMGFVDTEFDEDFVQKLTGMSVADVPLSLIGNWLAGTLEFQWDPRPDERTEDTIGDVARVSSLGRSKAESEQSTVLPYDPAPTPERLCIDNAGAFYYLPATDNVEQYETELETTFTDPHGDWSTVDVANPKNVIRFDDGTGNIRTMPRKVQANRVIYTDFRTGLLSYTDSESVLKIYDISSFRALTASHIREFLDLTLRRETVDNEEFLNMLNAAIRQAFIQFPPTTGPHQTYPIYGLSELAASLADQRFSAFVKGDSSGSIVSFCSTMNSAYLNMPNVPEDTLEALRDLSFKHISPNSPFPELRMVYNALKRLADDWHDNFDNVASQYALLPTLERLGMLQVLVKNSPRYEEVFQEDRVLRDAYITPPEDYRTVTIPEIPFARGVKLMPHQVKVFASLKRFPRRFTLDVAAGGGKTFTAGLVAAMYMKHNGIRRPLVVCPDILLKNYFEDLVYAMSGAMNIIAVNSTILRRWGPERLGELIAKAPINTIVVAAFDGMAKGRRRIYGTRTLVVNPVVEFLQQFDFDMVIVDESHKIKNRSSNTNRNVSRLAARAKVSGIMTGTLIFNGAKDVVGQYNLMDPTIFGSDSYFEDKFMENAGGVKRAKTETPAAVKKRIRDRTAYVQVTRKEWAALLPPRVDEFTGEPTEVFHVLNDPQDPDEIKMTQAQTDYYNLMLQEVREQILKDAQSDASLQRLLSSMERRAPRGNAAADTTGDESDEDDLLEEVLNRLNPYLARLEIFVCNPLNSREVDFTSKLASEEDKISPKAKKVIQICRRHLERGYIGKILVFTQYNESAEGIYNALPPELKALAVHYRANNKTSLSQFENTANKMILVGNERSIGTGLNLQMASRIIRCESTWNWGALEQAESRVNRPVPKSEELRKAIYLDWILVNGTIDVTKICRMISKAVESYKFTNAGNPLFDQMEALEPVKMSLENILLRNDIRDPNHNVEGHFTAMNYCRAAEEAEFQAFRNDPNIRTDPYLVEGGGILPGSGILKNVPYVPGAALYAKDELKLVPFISFVTEHSKSTLTLFNPVDLVIHTEDGDGICVGATRSGGEIRSVKVQLPNGSKETYDISSVFVVNRGSVDVDTRREVAERIMSDQLGRPVQIAPQAPLAVPPTADEGVPNRGQLKLLRNKPVPNADTKANKEYALYCMSLGHIYTLTTSDDDPDTPIDVLQELGFQEVRPYYYAEIKNPQMLQQWFDKAKKVTGFTKDCREQIQEMIELMAEHRPGTFFQNVTPSVLRDFWREQRAAPRAGMTNAFVSVEDNGQGKRPKIYLVAFKHQNPQFRNVTSKVRIPGLVFEATEDNQYWYLAKSQKDAIKKLNEVNSRAPIKNFNQMLAKLNSLRPTAAK